jgi:aminoglycoside phosphotransferase (APT) family kinase protein
MGIDVADVAVAFGSVHHGGPLRSALFTTEDPVVAAEVVVDALGPLADRATAVLHVGAGVGLVLALATDSGPGLFVKVHRWRVTVERLAAVHDVQRAAADAGLPAPRPLADPVVVGTGVLTVEEHRPAGIADGRRPPVRRALASTLAAFHRLGTRFGPLPEVGGAEPFRTSAGTWTEPHDLRFDLDRSAEGAGWIDAAADEAVDALATLDDGPEVLTHADWRTGNLGFDGDDLVAIYDWDSVGRASEARAIGQILPYFSADWSIGAATIPSLPDQRAFIADYEHARGRSFTAREHAVIEAAALLNAAYAARCEHSDRVLCWDDSRPDDGGLAARLRDRLEGWRAVRIGGHGSA